MADDPKLAVARRAARNAGDLILRACDRIDRLRVQEKSPNDYVTEVDQAAEELIVQEITRVFPEHCIIAEEGEVINPESDCKWYIDPLDGTTNFVRGVPHYAVSIAYMEGGVLQQAIVFDPIKREEYSASRGRGAWLNGRRTRVSGRPGLAGALLCTGVPFGGQQMRQLDSYLVCMAQLLHHGTAGIRRLGSAALDLAYIAAGRYDGYWEIGLKPWDLAAGALLVMESGGLVGDLSGGDGWLESGDMVAASPEVYAAMQPIAHKHLGG